MRVAACSGVWAGLGLRQASPAAQPVNRVVHRGIIAEVKTQTKGLGSCIAKARSANELTFGPMTFVLDWTIRPDGSVSGARLTGPAAVLGTSLPDCFAAQISTWKFPASIAGAPIRNFPMPVKIP